MAKGDKKEVKNEVNAEQNRVNDQFGNIYNEMEAKREATEAQSNQERQQLLSNLNPAASSVGGGLDETVVNNIRNLYGGKTVGLDGTSVSGTSSGSSSGGDSGSGSSSVGGATPNVAQPATPNPMNTAEGVWNNFAQTGGVDMAAMQSKIGELENLAKSGGFRPEDLAGVNETIAKLKAFQYDPAAKAQIESTISQLNDMGRTGGYSPEAIKNINASLDRLRSESQTGGVDPNELAKMRGTNDFLRGGGISDSDLDRYRGTGYAEFAETGGWNPEDKAEFRNRSTSAIPSLYNTTRNEAERLRNIQGGSGGAGFLAASNRLNRQTGQDLATASRDAEVDLGSQVREGRKWGIEGVRDTEQLIQDQLGKNRATGVASSNALELGIGANKAKMLDDLISGETNLNQNIAGNKLAANEASGKLQLDLQNSINDAIQKSLTGAGNIEANIATAISQNRVKAQEAATQAESVAQKLRQEGQMAGAQGLMQVAAQKEAAARAAGAQAAGIRANDQANERWWATFVSGNERWIGEQEMQGRTEANRNLTQIYGMDPTLPRDAFTAGIATDHAAANRGLLGIDAQSASSGKDWTDWATMGLGALSGMNFGSGGGSSADVMRPSGQNINDFNASDIGGAIDTSPGADIWNTPTKPNLSEDGYWF